MGDSYIAKVKIRIDGVVYGPGSVLDESIIPDLEYLVQKGFVVPAPAARQKETGPAEMEESLGFHPMEFADEDDGRKLEFLTEDKLKKLGSKAAIVEYAESIGLSGLNVNEHKTELIDQVLAYIDEVLKNDV